MFSMVTVASSTRMPTASASPPRVMMLRVWPVSQSAMIADSAARGMEVAMMTVERQLPRNSRIIMLVRAAAMMPSRKTPFTAAFTNSDWSLRMSILRESGNCCLSRGRRSLMPCTTSRVETTPFLSTWDSTAREPSTCTTLAWGGLPSRTWPTSRTRMVAPPTVLTGRLFIFSIVSAELLSCTAY